MDGDQHPWCMSFWFVFTKKYRKAPLRNVNKIGIVSYCIVCTFLFFLISILIFPFSCNRVFSLA